MYVNNLIAVEKKKRCWRWRRGASLAAGGRGWLNGGSSSACSKQISAASGWLAYVAASYESSCTGYQHRL